MARRSIKDLERRAERLSQKSKGWCFKINQNASGYNVYKTATSPSSLGYHLAFAGSLSECIAFLDGIDYILSNMQ